MRWSLAGTVIAMAGVVAGCAPPANLGFAIAVTVEVDQSISDAGLASVRTLQYHVTGDETYDRSEPLGRTMGRVERFVYRPGTASRTVQLTLTARDGSDAPVGSGLSPVVELMPDQTSEVTVVIAAASTLDGGILDAHMVTLDAAGTSCDDGEQNGDEAGIDCGGSCTLKCPGATCASAGECVTGTCNTVCVLASGPPSWLPEPGLPSSRMDHGCAVTPDGNILIVGGSADGNNSQGILETLSHQPGSTDWVNGPSLVHAHSLLAVVTDKTGKIYAIGGYDVFNATLGAEALGATGWASIANMLQGHSQIGAALIPDGRLVLVDNSSNEAYTVLGNSWTHIPSSAVLRENSGVATGVDGLMYSFGGNDTMSGRKNNEAWNPADGKWSTRASLSRARQQLGAVAAPDGRLYAIGGLDNTGADETLDTVEAYTPSTDRWTVVSAMLTRRNRFGACLARDGRIFATGGFDGTTSIAAVDVYGPVITYAPSAPISGKTISVSLHNFAASARLRVTYDGTTAVIGTTDSVGDANLSFPLPMSAPGDHTLSAVDVRSVYPVSTVVKVGP